MKIDNNKQTLKEAGYKHISCNNSQHVLLNLETGKNEIFWSNKNHASWGLKYKNTHLEFIMSEPINTI
ncbi:MAG: hypothetical protein ABIP51_23720 [Bacteroidia bacterium]